MNYFATLAVGGQYLYAGKVFVRGEEQAVSTEEANYLKTLHDNRLIDQGEKRALLPIPLFSVRELAPTVEEKVLEEIKTAPTTLKPTKSKDAE